MLATAVAFLVRSLRLDAAGLVPSCSDDQHFSTQHFSTQLQRFSTPSAQISGQLISGADGHPVRYLSFI